MESLIKVFFAIPCGIIYENQREIIFRLCKSYNIVPLINENDYLTDSLLNQIFDQINKCEYFVADVSSNSPNVIFELGYAFKAKHRSKIAILLSNISKCPSDLQDIKRLQYGSYRDFAEKLNSWLSQFFIESIKIDDSYIPLIEYYETFKDHDNFLKRWDTPFGCDYSLTFNGFRFSNAHLPILSKHLAYLENFVFEFECSIDRNVIGWVINGTKFDPGANMLDFCLMFNLNIDGHFTPHIFSKPNIDTKTHYHVYDGIIIKEKIEFKKRLNIKTFVSGSMVSIQINNLDIYKQDFAKEPFKILYNSITNKTNQIGFRCHPGEEATIYSVRIDPIKT